MNLNLFFFKFRTIQLHWKTLNNRTWRYFYPTLVFHSCISSSHILKKNDLPHLFVCPVKLSPWDHLLGSEFPPQETHAKTVFIIAAWQHERRCRPLITGAALLFALVTIFITERNDRYHSRFWSPLTGHWCFKCYCRLSLCEDNNLFHML